MRDQVTRQLERARLAARSTVVGTLIDVPPVVHCACPHHGKAPPRHATSLSTIDLPDHARFRGEQQDLEEMVGNLVDNACKWAQLACGDRGVGRSSCGETVKPGARS